MCRGVGDELDNRGRALHLTMKLAAEQAAAADEPEAPATMMATSIAS